MLWHMHAKFALKRIIDEYVQQCRVFLLSNNNKQQQTMQWKREGNMTDDVSYGPCRESSNKNSIKTWTIQLFPYINRNWPYTNKNSNRKFFFWTVLFFIFWRCARNNAVLRRNIYIKLRSMRCKLPRESELTSACLRKQEHRRAPCTWPLQGRVWHLPAILSGMPLQRKKKKRL